MTNVALPAIALDLGGGAEGLSWIINAYLLPLSALLLLGGAAGDQFGRRRTLIAGIVLFTLTSVGCALSDDLSMLLAARVVQGIGAAILLPNSLGILGSSFEGEARGRAVGTWAAAGAIASAIGTPLGGWLIGSIGWRANFYLNVPVAIAAVVIAARFIDESEPGKMNLDWGGAALATGALGALTWALTFWSAHHAMSIETWIGLGLGTILLFGFFLLEHRLGEIAMMPLSLFASRAFVGLTILTFLLYGALGGLLVLLPYLLITGGGYTPLQAGLALLRIAARRPPDRAHRAAPAADDRTDRHGPWLCDAGDDRPDWQLRTDRLAQRHRHRARNGGCGCPVDDSRTVFSRRSTYRDGLRLQQCDRAYWRADRNCTRWRGYRRDGHPADERLPYGRARRRDVGDRCRSDCSLRRFRGAPKPLHKKQLDKQLGK